MNKSTIILSCLFVVLLTLGSVVLTAYQKQGEELTHWKETAQKASKTLTDEETLINQQSALVKQQSDALTNYFIKCGKL